MRKLQLSDLDDLLNSAQLPALPQSAIRLIELSQDPNNGPAEFAVPIESDPGLTGQVLRFVNSSYFGFSREISSVKLAITLVGIRTIKNFALWSAVFSLMPNPKCGPFDLKSLWQDSLRRALFARAMAKFLGMKEPEEPFAAALLQDMAVPLLAKEIPQAYADLLTSRDDGRLRLSDLEQRTFGWTHAEAGERLARRWGLPDTFAGLIVSHVDEPACEPRNRGQLGATAVMLSALLPSVSDSAWYEQNSFQSLYFDLMGRNVPALEDVFARVDAEFTEFAPLLKIASPSRTLAEMLARP